MCPLDATDAEMQVALGDALAPIKLAIEEAQAHARRARMIASAGTGLPWRATERDKAEAAAATRSALSQLPLVATGTEQHNAVAAAVAPIKRAIEERAAVQQRQAQREKKKSTLVMLAVFHASNYLDEQHNDGEIELEPGEDFDDVRRDLEATIRSALQEELNGDESQDEASRIAREIVDRELD